MSERSLQPLPSPSTLLDAEGERGTSDVEVLASVKQASDDAAKAESPVIFDAAEASERKRLIAAIKMKRRYRMNLVVQQMLTGAMWGFGGAVLFELGRSYFKRPSLPAPRGTHFLPGRRR